MIAPFVATCLPAIELSKLRQSSKAWQEAANQTSLWLALAQYHFTRTLARDIKGRADFVQTVSTLRGSLRSRPGRIESWLDMAFSRQPCPPSDKTGLALLVECEAHKWILHQVIQSAASGQRTCDVSGAIKLLDLLSSKSAEARQSTQEFMRLCPTLVIIVERHMVSQMLCLRGLRPEVGRSQFGIQVISFESLDCRKLSREDTCLNSLHAGCSLICNLFSNEDDVRDSAVELAKDWQQSTTAASAELSGEWRTAVSCQFQRLDYVPGNLEIRFESSGTLQGRGRDGMDPHQDFTLTGFWNTEIVLMRKLASAYTVDLLGFFEADGSIRGAWLLGGMSGGFWACKGPPRHFDM